MLYAADSPEYRLYVAVHVPVLVRMAMTAAIICEPNMGVTISRKKQGVKR